MASRGGDDAIWAAVTEATAPLEEVEDEAFVGKFSHKVARYFRQGAKHLDFHAKMWQQLVNEYADSVYGTLFQAFGDKDWLAQLDFLMALDAGIKNTFPPQVFYRVPQHIFEQAVLQASDRAFEEQRFARLCWDQLRESFPDAKMRKHAYNALDAGRKFAGSRLGYSGALPQDFLRAWVDHAVQRMTKSGRGDPAEVMPLEDAAAIFHVLLGAGAMPVGIVNEHGAPPTDWPDVEVALADAYARCAGGGGGGEGDFAGPAAPQGKGCLAGYGSTGTGGE
eukprot:CAMPEP_0170228920 /NCGR_PEP_ID=MMETSP0116_2-20130129/14181_1 /TAXON_ID=400756 /ORGANISM="Durinskia baltica, Strain CSIRO CS-38" /LENGTH=278 /DNA_ID=CAMNT_0010479665 /DNA_START=32 /DNA_END=865 /DNA_ORIENTATION=-